MDESRRRAYLHALGVEVWEARAPAYGARSGAAPAAPLPDSAPVPAGLPGSGQEGPVAAAAVAGMDWPQLRAAVAACHNCELRDGCTQTVFGVGDPQARWMVVGEAPGAEEDRQGEPFVGRAGQLLTSMLAAIGLSREQVFIANVLKCRPPGNRDPRPLEAAACEPYLRRQIVLVRPRIILAVGRIAAQNLLRTDTPIGKMRGQRYTYGDLDTPLVVTYHPAYLLRSPGEKRKAWDDLRYAASVAAQVA